MNVTSQQKHIIYIVAFYLILDSLGGIILEKAYFSKTAVTNDKLIHSVLGTNEEMLIFGSSRAQHHYNPKIFIDSLGVSCYNVGNGGQNIFFHYALLKATFERYKPKIVLLDLSYIDFEKTQKEWDKEKLGALLPFYRRSKAAREAILLRGRSEKLKTLSNLYLYNSTLYGICRNLYNPKKSEYGYIPLLNVWKLNAESEKSNSLLDTDKINCLKQFVKTSIESGSKVIVIISPHYIFSNNNICKDSVKSILISKYKIKLWDYEKDNYFINHRELFNDPFHLNNSGANIFSKMIASRIKYANFD